MQECQICQFPHHHQTRKKQKKKCNTFRVVFCGLLFGLANTIADISMAFVLLLFLSRKQYKTKGT